MKVLFLTGQQVNLETLISSDSYHGGGWISALQGLLEDNADIQLGIVVTGDQTKFFKKGSTKYYAVQKKKENSFSKIRHYYGGYKNTDAKNYDAELLKIIEQFQPDIIQLFGTENIFASIVDKTTIPIVIHIQGVLGPCNNAFYPVGINASSFLWPFTFREWVKRNGFIYAQKNLEVRAKKEEKTFKAAKYFMGRTTWDHNISRLLSPDSEYFHVDEVLRDSFYNNAGKWQPHHRQKIKIVSTVSETIYKGLDLILKTAALLKKDPQLDFEWSIIGISTNSNIVKFFQKQLKIDAASVHVYFKGVLEPDKICEMLQDADVFVHPSYIDNSPNSVCEAQIVGVPIIATNIGGIPSLISHQENGLLVPANASFDLAYYINKLTTDMMLCKTFSEAGIKLALTRHNKKKITKELVDTYNEILKQVKSLKQFQSYHNYRN